MTFKKNCTHFLKLNIKTKNYINVMVEKKYNLYRNKRINNRVLN